MPVSDPFLENELASTLPLDGLWEFQLAEHPPQAVPVPSAWENFLADKVTDGPAVYRRTFHLPPGWAHARRIIFEADAVSFEATVRVNGQLVGTHRGLWSPFQLDMTGLAQPGENVLELEVWKPGRRIPLREALAGFLPDVATMFGGPWQSLRLRALDVAVGDLRVLGQQDHHVLVGGALAGLDPSQAAEVRLEVHGRAGEPPGQTAVALPPGQTRFSARIDGSRWQRWWPEGPALYRIEVTVWQGGTCLARASRRTGLRNVQVREGAAWLDDRPLHLRGVLDWGWHPRSIRPAPSREAVEQQVAQLRSLGFNLVKLCLFVPDEATFDVADESGALLWLEMPMWLPRVTPEFKALALSEYAAVFRRLHHHPSIVVLSLGCELNREADAEFLQALDDLAREYFPNVLLCDNSGSAEAYGGVQTGLSDFYDYHFYTDPHFFGPLVDHFHRGYRPPKPWLYGEFCDADTCRDFSQLQPEPWWLTDPVPLERDDFLYMRAYRERLAQAGVQDGARQLVQIARSQATAVRQHILELTRQHSATGGYVVSGWADTPITTSGIVDDQGELKFDPETWRRFNADAVLVIDRERRRRWVHGGDRPAYRDPYSWWAGERAEVHVLLSNGLDATAGGELRWRLTTADGADLAAGAQPVRELRAAQVEELAVLALPMGQADVPGPQSLTLAVDLDLHLASGGRAVVRNNWQLWAVPRPRLPVKLAVAGSLAHNHYLDRLDRQAQIVELEAGAPDVPLLASELTGDVLRWVAAGGRGVVWLRQPDRRLTRGLPFWREAIHVFEPHPLWAQVPHAGHADLRFYSVATDMAIDLDSLCQWLGREAACTPVWRRFDARQLTWVSYVVEVRLGRGRLLLSTLRHAGGLGRQPEGFDANPWGAWILAALLRTVTE